MSDRSDLSDGTPDTLVRWLLLETPPAATTLEVLQRFANRLSAMGLDLIRMNIQARPLSPQASSLLYVWRPAERDMELSPHVRIVDREEHALDSGRLQVVTLAHGAFETAAFRASPFHLLISSGGQEVRRPITADQTDFEFPILKDLHAQGATDYIALPLTFYDSAPSAVSFATRKPG